MGWTLDGEGGRTPSAAQLAVMIWIQFKEMCGNGFVYIMCKRYNDIEARAMCSLKLRQHEANMLVPRKQHLMPHDHHHQHLQYSDLVVAHHTLIGPTEAGQLDLREGKRFPWSCLGRPRTGEVM